MKKLITLLLALMLLLSITACGGGQTAETSEESQKAEEAAEVVEEAEEEENTVTQLEEPIVIADNEYFKLEAVAKCPWSIDEQVLFKCVLENKTDNHLWVQMSSASIDGYMVGGGDCFWLDPDQIGPGKKAKPDFYFQHFEANDMYATEIKSAEDIQNVVITWSVMTSADGESYSDQHLYESKILFDSASAETNTSNTAESTGDQDGLYGTWEAVEVNTGSGDYTVAEMESHKLFAWSDWNIIVSETGEVYLQTNNTSAKNDAAVVTSTEITAGKNKWTLDGDRLVLNSGSATVYYEKTSDDQTFPDLEKKELVDLLKGTWKINSSSRTGDFTFADTTATATINGVVFNADTMCIIMKDKRITISAIVGENNMSMDLSYTYDNGELSLTYSGDTLTKQ